MAPSKKKKAAANPARGFATISTISKSKAQSDIEPAESSKSGSGEDAQADQDENSSPTLGDQPGKQVDLGELSPEDLEHHLEESELQNLLEQHAEKVKQDARRQLNRLHTEKRLLRSQADHLIVQSWLPTQLMQLVESVVQSQLLENVLSPCPTRVELSKTFPADGLLLRLWTLEQVLTGLGFQQGKARDAIAHVVWRKVGQTSEQAAARDTLWGLEECLEWLACFCDPEELPSYTVDTTTSRERPSSKRDDEGDSGSDSPTAAPESFRHPTTFPNSTKASIEGDDEVEIQDQTPLSSSGSEEDDPKAMVDRYLALLTKLYSFRPDLANVLTDSRASNSKKRSGKYNPTFERLGPYSTRLVKKLSKIQDDILFDRDEAQGRWIEIRNDLARDAADRRRLQLDSNSTRTQASKSETQPLPLGPEAKSPKKDGSEDIQEDASDMLEDLFASLPELSTDANPGAASLQTASPDSDHVVVRDFGRSVGLKPFRVLEDACKARDASSRIFVNRISSESFSNRYSLTIQWSSKQHLPPDMPWTPFTCKASSKSIKVGMKSVSTPTGEQGEAYVATAALFLVFSHSPKEEKVHLRLPSIWRDLWAEFSKSQQDCTNAVDRAALRDLRKLVPADVMPADVVPPEIPSSKANGHFETNGDFRPGVESIESAKGSHHFLGTSEELIELWSTKASTASFKHMLNLRQTLPISEYRHELLQAIEENQAVIICGETGCGKSTQVPSFILEHELSHGRHCNIYCTEPRRISAISLARRVSEELGERKKDIGTPRSLVGYAIRLESRISSQTRLVYATTGIVMRMLEGSNELADITHLVLDEVHERTLDSDFLLIVLRQLMARRQTLRVILMSATVNANRFSEYMGRAPIFNIPGRTYPVETLYLEDAIEVSQYQVDPDTDRRPGSDDEEEGTGSSTMQKDGVFGIPNYTTSTCDALFKLNEYRLPPDLIVHLLGTIATKARFASYSRAILVFLPGLAEIRRLNDLLSGHPTFRDGWVIHPLHSSIAIEEQEQAFSLPPEGKRKIVLSTNIAETGVTIPDITCVVDTGKHREMRFDERRQLSRLIEVFISRANAKQRKGRAGRVQKGLYFGLYTRARHENIFSEEQTPEMLRLSLQDLILRIKISSLGAIEDTLTEALDPPSSKAIRRAIIALIDVKALTTAEELTALGRQLAKLPLDVFLGKLIIIGSIVKCLDATLTIAAILTSKSPFSAPVHARAQADLARVSFRRGDSDLLTIYNAYLAWRRVRKGSTGISEFQFCRRNFLSQQTLSSIEELKTQLLDSLVEAGFIGLDHEEMPTPKGKRSKWQGGLLEESLQRYSMNNDNDVIINSVIIWSFYPKLLKSEGKGWRNIANNQSVKLHPSTVNKGIGRNQTWLSFYHIMQSANKFYNAHETSAAEDLAIALLCGDADFKMYAGVIIIDGNRLRFQLDDWRAMLALKNLRLKMREILIQAYRDPGRSLSSQQQVWFDIWQSAFTHRAMEKRSSCPQSKSAGKSALPPLPSLTHLTILPPSDGNAFQSLVALRLALQAAAPPRLTHLNIDPLSIRGILALRSGPFSAFSGTNGAALWPNLRSLSISVLPWWTSAEVSNSDIKEVSLSHSGKASFKILHDWLGCFATSSLDHLRFEWLGLEDGPNPFLLDVWATEHARGKPWFSAPGFRWRMLEEITMKGVEIDDEGVKEVKARVKGLKKLEIETAWGEEQVQGGLVAGDRGEWCVDILSTIEEEPGEVESRETVLHRDIMGRASGKVVDGSPESLETDWSGSVASLGLGVK